MSTNKLSAGGGGKKKGQVVTASSKLFVSIVCFVVVNSLYESGKQMTEAKQQDHCYETYQAEVKI